jgi:plexin A
LITPTLDSLLAALYTKVLDEKVFFFSPLIVSIINLFLGICSVRNLKNISEELMEVREPVVANNSTATTVVFIAPGPPNPPTTHVLYVGVTYTGNSPYRSEVPAVSSRSLARHEMFQIAKMEVTTGTRISVNSLSRDRYPIHYVYGFSSEGFSYFLTTQMRESTNNSPYISKLVRVCQDDRDYYSYTEVPLECVAENGTRYNLIQAAYVDKPGSDLAAELGIRAQDDVLFAVFAQSDPAEGGEMSNRPAPRSALCVYSLKSIRRKFMHNIQKCFSGEGHRGLDFISPSLPCVHTVSATPFVH